MLFMKEKWVVNGFEQEKWINEKFRENIFKSLEAVVHSALLIICSPETCSATKYSQPHHAVSLL